MPLIYLDIWDCIPYPMYNRPFYESCDALFAISKQTDNINKMVLGPENCCRVDGWYDKDGMLHPYEKMDTTTIIGPDCGTYIQDSVKDPANLPYLQEKLKKEPQNPILNNREIELILKENK
jgi:hypothetical protein